MPAPRWISLGVSALPLVAALVVWGVANFTWDLTPGFHPSQDAAVGLTLVGPGATLAALAARQWFPRLLGLVIVSALCAVALVARALAG